MKFASKNRSAASCKPSCNTCNCNRTTKGSANVNVNNTYAKTKIANPTVVWDYKESIKSDIADTTNNTENENTSKCPSKFDYNKISKEGKSSRANRGRLNAMVLG